MKLISDMQLIPVVVLFSLIGFWAAGLAAEESNRTLRIATYNASLYGKQAGQIYQRLSDGIDRQAEDVASIVQTVRPDILLINEIDYDKDARTANVLAREFFAKGQQSLQPIDYPYIYSVPSNTGVDSGMDLNNNGRTGEPHDCWGYGVYPGQYSMAVFSRFPIKEEQIRSFQTFLWKDLPGALRPIDPSTDKPYYDDPTWEKLRLSSKNHIDIPIEVEKKLTVHVLASHPTPPVFDGAEDRNGCRNHDEIQFWNVYLSQSGSDLMDDRGNHGGLPETAAFVIMGDLNADPVDGDGRRVAINTLISNQRLRDPLPNSVGAVADAKGNKASERQQGNPATDTANFGRNGNLRVDFVLPSKALALSDSGVFWPQRESEGRSFMAASDHRMVWIDVNLP